MDQEKFNVIMSAFVFISDFALFLLAHFNIIDKSLVYTLFVIQALLYSFNEFSRAWLIYITTHDKKTWEKAQQILGKDLTEKALKNAKVKK